MKICLTLALFVFSALWANAQLAPMQLPKKITWMEETSARNARGEVTRTCNVFSIEGENWRSEFANQQAEIAITVCSQHKVASSQTPAPAPSEGPAADLTSIYTALSTKAKFEVVDIIGGVGYSRYRETGSSGYTRLIWMDRTIGFPRRISTTLSDGSVREQSMRVLNVDASLERRLFNASNLYPFFGHYLDEWHARLTK